MGQTPQATHPTLHVEDNRVHGLSPVGAARRPLENGPRGGLRSGAAIAELVKVKLTEAPPESNALFIVIWPVTLFSVTPVDLLVACVTVPPAPVP